ncbi:MAG: DUF192 domain-containing protein [Dehalococcoidia bacterium]
MTRRMHLLVTAGALLLLLASCAEGSNDAAPAATDTPATAGCNSTPSSTATPAISDRSPGATPEPTASTGATSRDALALVEFVRASGGSVCLPTEVVPRNEFTIGLSGRYTLDDRGMLFYWGTPHQGSFWMKNTHVDLSIAFVGADSRIVEIREMQAESLDYVTPSVAYSYAIEAQPGWYARNAVSVGDEVRFDDEVAAQLPAAQ